MKQSTINSVMEGIEREILRSQDQHEIFNRVNWYIVKSSHDICTRHQMLGHARRQIIRRKLWAIARMRYPAVRKFLIEGEINGHSKYFIVGQAQTSNKGISITSRIIRYIKNIF